MSQSQRKQSPAALHSLTIKSGLRRVQPGPVLPSAKLKTVISTFDPLPSTVSAPLVLSARHPYEIQAMGAFIAATDVRELNSGYPIMEFPQAGTPGSPTGTVTLNLLNRPATGYAMQYRVFNDAVPSNPGKYRIDAYINDYFTPAQTYELSMQPNHQTFGFYLPPPTTNLLWLSLYLYPVWASAGKWTLYDITVNAITF